MLQDLMANALCRALLFEYARFTSKQNVDFTTTMSRQGRTTA